MRTTCRGDVLRRWFRRFRQVPIWLLMLVIALIGVICGGWIELANRRHVAFHADLERHHEQRRVVELANLAVCEASIQSYLIDRAATDQVFPPAELTYRLDTLRGEANRRRAQAAENLEQALQQQALKQRYQRRLLYPY